MGAPNATAIRVVLGYVVRFTDKKGKTYLRCNSHDPKPGQALAQRFESEAEAEARLGGAISSHAMGTTPYQRLGAMTSAARVVPLVRWVTA